MKIARTTIDGHRRTVVEHEGRWADITEPLAELAVPQASIKHLIASGMLTTPTLSRLADSATSIAPPERFELPLTPSKVVCLGRNYAEHARELGNAVPDAPVLFNKTPNTYIADGDAIAFDPFVGRVDHEGEIALVMGLNGLVAGYTLLNDVTARDLQSADKAKGLPWFRAKNLDTFCPIGPTIRLADSLPNPPDLDLELLVNGTLRQSGNTRQFIFDIPAMLGYIAQYITLEPGDLVATGTPPGVGPLMPGDRVEVNCAAIGVLRSAVIAK